MWKYLLEHSAQCVALHHYLLLRRSVIGPSVQYSVPWALKKTPTEIESRSVQPFLQT